MHKFFTEFNINKRTYLVWSVWADWAFQTSLADHIAMHGLLRNGIAEWVQSFWVSPRHLIVAFCRTVQHACNSSHVNRYPISSNFSPFQPYARKPFNKISFGTASRCTSVGSFSRYFSVLVIANGVNGSPLYSKQLKKRRNRCHGCSFRLFLNCVNWFNKYVTIFDRCA